MRSKRKRAALAPGLEALEAKTLLSVGVNIVGNPTWVNNGEWVDAQMTFSGWQAPDGSTTPALTADGYPKSAARSWSYMLDYPDGVYHLSWRGTATVGLSGKDAKLGPVTVGSDGVSRADATIKPTTGSGLLLDLTVKGLDPNHPFDAFHMISPGYAANTTEVFRDAFLQRLQPFSVLRVMNSSNTVNTTVADWSARTTPQDWLQTAWTKDAHGGVAWEYSIELANQLHKDLWISVPDQASDDYINHLAQLFRDELHPDAKIYVEYGNETWNTTAPPYQRVLADALANPLLTATDPFQRVAQQTGVRLKRISDIFRADFGSRAPQVLPVFGAQDHFTLFAKAGLSFLNATYGDPSGYIAGMGIAPYVKVNKVDDVPGMTMDALFASMEKDLQTVQIPAIEANADLAARYHLGLFGYETGQTLVSPNGVNTDLKIAAQDDPRMGQIYRELWAAWSRATDGPFNLFDYAQSYTKFGSYGLLPTLNAPGSMKWDTVMSLILPGGDATLDGQVDHTDFAILKQNFGKSNQWWQQGDFNQDNRVDQADLDILRADLGPVTPAQAVEIALFQAPTTAIASQPVALDRTGRAGSLHYSWSVTGGTGSLPGGTDAPFSFTPDASGTLPGGTDAPFSFTPDASGTYVVSLTISDASGHSASGSVTIAATGDPPLFQDQFAGANLNPAWLAGGNWALSNGVLNQTSTARGDGLPQKAQLRDQVYPANVTIVAKVRVNQWAAGDAAKVGVSLDNDPNTRQGYSLVFHGTNQVQFSDDGVALGNAYPFQWTTGTWYWFALSDQGGTLLGKVWADGTPEPSGWMFTQAGWSDRTSGAPGLFGGQSDGTSYATSSFDNVTLSAAPAPAGLRAAAVASQQVNLAWDGSATAASYAIEQSPDGLYNWTQVGTTAASVTTFQDATVQPSTTYVYRVRALDSSNHSTILGNLATVTPPIGNALLFADDFSATKLNPAWLAGGNWALSNGVLNQTSTARGDGLPQKAQLRDQVYPANVTIVAKVRVNQWAAGDAAKVGVSLDNDPNTRQGYSLVFHGTNQVQFSDDGVALGNAYPFQWTTGTWYWFALSDQGGTLLGKVWADGTPEPSGWMFTQAGWSDRTSGAPGLFGGQSDGTSYATSSFDNVTLSAAPAPAGLRAAAVASQQVNLAWDGSATAASYAIDRSLNGLNNWTQVWTQVGTTAASVTTFQDATVQPSTTYVYRVRALDSSNHSTILGNLATVTPLFSDDFSASKLNSAWLAGSNWVLSNGVLSQTSTARGDGLPQKARLGDQTYPADVTIVAEVRVDQWAAGDAAKVGVSLRNDTKTRLGYDLAFHGTNQVQFIDGETVGHSYAFDWSPGVWYWFELSIQDGTLYGKVWQAGTSEPTTWMFTQTGWSDHPSGAPGLLGGQSDGTSYATSSFDNVEVRSV